MGGNSSNSGKIFTSRKKIIIRIMAGARPGTCCRSLFKPLEILPTPCLYILLLMTLLSIIGKIFKHFHLYTILIQGISIIIIFMDEMPTNLVLTKVQSMLA